MTLCKKIESINVPQIADPTQSIGPLPDGNADTIAQFFEEFIKNRLPDQNVVKKWHNILMEYTNDANLGDLSCCVRFGNNGGKSASKWGETGYYKLRRGWLTQNTTDNFEYFFADNAFPAFVYKLALDGFVPADVNELKDVFRQHKFPYSFGFFIDNSINEYKGVVIDKGVNPGFLGHYKLSHIFDAGEHFNINGSQKGDAALSEVLEYYPIGHSDDFLKEPDQIRKMPISDDAKKVIVAKFLRFAHPFNYFLTPTKKHHICGQYVYKKDIGEDPRMISYMRWYCQKTYPKEYAEFLQKIMWYGKSDGEQTDGQTQIDITYGLGVNSKASKTTGASATTTSAVKKKTISASNEFADFEAFAQNNGVKNPKGYSTHIRAVMAELNIKTAAELAQRIDEAIDHCTQKWQNAKAANDKNEKKKYSDYRSALRKYKAYLLQQTIFLQNSEDFLKKLNNVMEDAELDPHSIGIYLRKIKELLEKGLSVNDLCGAIDEIIQAHSKNGNLYDPKDHGNTKAALNHVKKMLSYPHITYRKGWSSWVDTNAHIVEYYIRGNTITFSKNIGFYPSGSVTKKINAKQMDKLIALLDEARNYNLFESSDTRIQTVHGPICTYSYSYRDMSGVNCGSLFNNDPRADSIRKQYNDWLDAVTK